MTSNPARAPIAASIRRTASAVVDPYCSRSRRATATPAGRFPSAGSTESYQFETVTRPDYRRARRDHAYAAAVIEVTCSFWAGGAWMRGSTGCARCEVCSGRAIAPVRGGLLLDVHDRQPCTGRG